MLVKGIKLAESKQTSFLSKLEIYLQASSHDELWKGCSFPLVSSNSCILIRLGDNLYYYYSDIY